MSRLRIACIACVLLTFLALTAATAAEVAGKTVAPPAIHLPHGAKVQTELNFGNNDVLGLVKELLPALGDLVSIGSAAGGPMGLGPGGPLPVPAEMLSQIDFRPLAEVLDGITNFRMIVASHKTGVPADDILAQFSSGAAKAGRFNRIITNLPVNAGVLAVFAQADGAGYLFYNYNAGDGKIQAVRLSGKVDVAKLMKWATETMKMFAVKAREDVTEEPPASEDDTEEVAPAPEE